MTETDLKLLEVEKRLKNSTSAKNRRDLEKYKKRLLAKQKKERRLRNESSTARESL